MKTHVETIYRARVDYDIDVWADIEESIEHRVLGFSHKGLSVVCWRGGPCWSPYIIIEGESLATVSKFVGKVERYIDKRKGAKVQP